MLESNSVQSNILYWIKDFLAGRTQCVCINDVSSTHRQITSGVLQGSVLDTLLFVIYIDGIMHRCKFNEPFSGIYLYADDMKLFSYRVDELQTNLDAAVAWLQLHQLVLAFNKCKHLNII